MMNFNFESITLTENRTLSSTEMKNLFTNKKQIEEAYEVAKDMALQQIIMMMKSGRAFTAVEVSEMTGLPIQAVISYFYQQDGVYVRTKTIEKTYCEIKNGSPDFNSLITIKRKINEYHIR